MNGFEIIRELAPLLTGNEIIVSCNGNISRQVYHCLPRPQVYLRGSMGLAIPVALGIAVSKPEIPVLTIVGDGNLLMGLSSLATTSFVRPNNLRVLILDNNAYATTGHQTTSSGVLDYSTLLSGVGIPSIETIQLNESLDSIRSKIHGLLTTPSLCALAALVSSSPPKLENIPLHPKEITEMLSIKETEHL